MKRVVSVWFPAWPITRMARANASAVPSDQAFALIDRGPRGLTITAVNDVARREGLMSGMALADARAALPSLISKPAEPEHDRRALLALARWAGRYGPNRHVDGDDGLWIDITGVAHLFSGEAALLDDLSRRLVAANITAHLGLASTLAAAHALARYAVPRANIETASRRWVLAEISDTRAALAGLPVAALRLDAASVVLLRRLGLRHIGQLYDLPRDSLERRFRTSRSSARAGAKASALAGTVLARLDQALGIVNEPRRPMQELPQLFSSQAFAEPLISSVAIETATMALCEDLCAGLRRRDLGVRSVRLVMFRSDGTTAEVHIGFSRAATSAPRLAALLGEKLDQLDAGFGVDQMRLEALRAAPAPAIQQVLSDHRSGDGCDVGADPRELVDRLSNRYGAEAITVAVARASHIPERAEKPVAAQDYFAAGGQGESAAAATMSSYRRPWPYGSQASCDGRAPQPLAGRFAVERLPVGRRPGFMLPRPEPIRVVAEVPDGPPVRFIWRRVERRVVRSEGPERIAPEWWQQLGLAETAPRQRPRDYYCIEDHSGAEYWVFRHGLYVSHDDDDASEALPTWFLHGVFA